MSQGSSVNASFNYYVDPHLTQFVQPVHPSFYAPAFPTPLDSRMNQVNENGLASQSSPSNSSLGVGSFYPDANTIQRNEASTTSNLGLLTHENDMLSFASNEFENGKVVPYTPESGAFANTSVYSLMPGAHSSLGEEDILVQISDCMAHLIDQEASPLLAEGTFSVLRLSQNCNRTATIIQVGDSLHWPLGSDETVVKVGPLRYIFSLHVTNDWSEKLDASTEQAPELLSYGITFSTSTSDDELHHLDDVLRSLCIFKEPDIQVPSDSPFLTEILQEQPKSEPSAQVLVPNDPQTSDIQPEREARDSEFWTRIAPCVDDYQSSTARTIAMGSGVFIRGILYLADSAKSGIEYTGSYMRKRMDKAEKDAAVSPRLKERMKTVRKVTKMTDKAASGVLKAITALTGKVASGLFHSKSFQGLVKSMPGEVTVSSLEAFDKTMDALEIAGKTVLKSTSRETRATVAHKYGNEAAELTKDGLCATGNLVHSAWSGVKIKKSFYPSKIVKNVLVTNLKSG